MWSVKKQIKLISKFTTVFYIFTPTNFFRGFDYGGCSKPALGNIGNINKILFIPNTNVGQYCPVIKLQIKDFLSKLSCRWKLKEEGMTV